MISTQFFLLIITVCRVVEPRVERANSGELPDETICGKSNATRIIGGHETKKHEFPWQVGIFINFAQGTAFCGGSVINANWVLTAAHCTKDENGKTVIQKNVTIVLGAHNLNKTESERQTSKAIKVIPHPQYNPKTINNDIALLKLEKPIEFTATKKTIVPVCVADEELFSERDITTVTGWGITFLNTIFPPTTFPPSSVLRKVGVPIVSLQTCKEAYPTNENQTFVLSEKNVCAGKFFKGTCSGDSGGPLVIKIADNWYQIGIVSWGAVPCALTRDSYSVFTNVWEFYPWITKTIKEKKVQADHGIKG